MSPASSCFSRVTSSTTLPFRTVTLVHLGSSRVEDTTYLGRLFNLSAHSPGLDAHRAANHSSRRRPSSRAAVPGADRAVPPGAAGALLPDARIVPGCRGRPAEHAADRLARPWRVRGARLAAHLAVPDCHQPVPRRAPRGQPAPGEGVGRAWG